MRKDAVVLLNELKRDRAQLDATIALIEGKLKPGQPTRKGKPMSAESRAKLSRTMKRIRAEKKAKG
jgi:hypothetical protein